MDAAIITGEKLYNSNLKSRSQSDMGNLDLTKDFDSCFKKWRDNIYGGLLLARGIRMKNEFPRYIGREETIYGYKRETLQKYIDYLKKLSKEVKTPWFQDDFEWDTLEQYQDFECPHLQRKQIIS